MFGKEDSTKKSKVMWEQRRLNWCGTPFSFTYYWLFEDELIIKTGVLSQEENRIDLRRIVDVSVKRTLLQRMFGLSTLVISTTDWSSQGVTPNPVGMGISNGFGMTAPKEVWLENIKDGGRLSDYITTLVNRARTLGNVRMGELSTDSPYMGTPGF